MSDIKWIKITTDVFDNEKIKLIKKMPEGKSILLIWFQLLTLAGKNNECGMIMLTSDLAYTDDMLAVYCEEPIANIRLALSMFEKFKMITIVDSILKITNWEKYQNISGMEKIKHDQNERQKKCRAGKKLIESASMSRDSHGTITNNVTLNHAQEQEHKKQEVEKEQQQDVGGIGDDVSFSNRDMEILRQEGISADDCILNQEEALAMKEVIAKYESYGVTTAMINKWIKKEKHSIGYLIEKVNVLEDAVNRGTSIPKPAGYLHDAVQNNYKMPKSRLKSSKQAKKECPDCCGTGQIIRYVASLETDSKIEVKCICKCIS